MGYVCTITTCHIILYHYFEAKTFAHYLPSNLRGMGKKKQRKFYSKCTKKEKRSHLKTLMHQLKPILEPTQLLLILANLLQTFTFEYIIPLFKGKERISKERCPFSEINDVCLVDVQLNSLLFLSSLSFFLSIILFKVIQLNEGKKIKKERKREDGALVENIYENSTKCFINMFLLLGSYHTENIYITKQQNINIQI